MQLVMGTGVERIERGERRLTVYARAEHVFTAWYGQDGRVAGVLAHDSDEDYERGQELIEQGAPWSS